MGLRQTFAAMNGSRPEMMQTNQHQIANATVGAGSGFLAAIIGWLQPIGQIASSVAAIIGCIISIIMLYRLLCAGKNNHNPKH